MTQVRVTEQEKKLLDFCAKGERSPNGDPYASVNGLRNGYPPLIRMTLTQVFQYQREWRSRRGSTSSAVGRYQFIEGTLRGAVRNTGIDPNTTIFDSVTQDFLILNVLRTSRGLDQWLSGSLSDVRFLTNLAKEFASIPVGESVFRPESRRRDGTIIWPARTIQPGESYYIGVNGNQATGHDNYTVVLQELADIRNGGPGATVTGTVGTAAPTLGTGTITQTERQATGGQALSGNGAPDTRQPNQTLPGVGNPYTYKPIDPLDNRYDFRTGEKVRDLSFNGVNPVAAGAYLQNNGLAPPNDIGTVPLTPEQLREAVGNRSLVGYSSGQIDPGLNEAARRAGVSPATTPNIDVRPYQDGIPR
jgi:hypothetical protein